MTFVRKPSREDGEFRQRNPAQQHLSHEKKRWSKQVWVAKGVGVKKAGYDVFSGDKQQKVSSVFERVGDQSSTSADPAPRGRRGQ